MIKMMLKIQSPMTKTLIKTAAILGMLAVVLGAFAAHALQNILNPEQIVSFQTGVRYQMFHALFLFFVANTAIISAKAKTYIYRTTLIGVLLFSGSIYLLNLDNYLLGIDIPLLFILTPIGGLFLIVSWALLLVYTFRSKEADSQTK